MASRAEAVRQQSDDFGSRPCYWCLHVLSNHTLPQLNDCATRKRLIGINADSADRERKRLYRILAER